MKSFVQAVKFLCGFAILGLNSTAYSAPRIPAQLRDNSLIYCTNASSFSLNPQQADMGANVNVVTDQLYDKLFELDPKTNQLKPCSLSIIIRVLMGSRSLYIYAKMCRFIPLAGSHQHVSSMRKM